MGIFDSGVGGLTVLAEAARLLPSVRFHYFADSGFAPYGEKPRDEILSRCLAITEDMIHQGAAAILVACNTATSSAIEDMRRRFPLPIVGMEPALKPAVEAGLPGPILVLGTAFTIREPKYQRLLRRFQNTKNIVSLPCPGLVNLIEAGHRNDSLLKDHLRQLLKDHLARDYSAIVLGCTHFVYLKDPLRSLFGDAVQFFDGNRGTARQLTKILQERGLLADNIVPAPNSQDHITFATSGDKNHVLPLCQILLTDLMKTND